MSCVILQSAVVFHWSTDLSDDVVRAILRSTVIFHWSTDLSDDVARAIHSYISLVD